MSTRNGHWYKQVIDIPGQHRTIWNLTRLRGTEGLSGVPEHAFHETIHGEAAVLAGMHIEGVFSNGDRVLDPRSAAGFCIYREAVLRYDRAAFNPAPLTYIDLPRPVSRISKFRAMKSKRRHVFTNRRWH